MVVAVYRPQTDLASASGFQSSAVHHLVAVLQGVSLSPSTEPFPSKLVENILSGIFVEDKDMKDATFLPTLQFGGHPGLSHGVKNLVKQCLFCARQATPWNNQ